MNITAPVESHVSMSIEKLNHLLISLNQARIGVDEKVMKENVIESVAGSGYRIDALA
jgi:hypothetical protein